ncbi:MAG TPA: enoyl-CoA hydratase-related protein [Burkholderiales bacterium]|nr:enoyl-CoA hydratase-related protein [Burkholderiales bacterium]
MAYEAMGFEMRDNVAWVTFNRPDALNAINAQATHEFYDIVNRISCDHSVRAVVLTGSGDRAFCAGGDVAEFHAKGDDVEALVREMTGVLHVGISRLAWLPAPVIAAVNGVAAGAGLSFAACCDLAIAADTAKFTSAYTHIGLTPDGSSTFFLTRLLGRRRVMEMYMTNRVLSAQEALDWGLVNRVVPAADLMSEVTKLANQLASGPTRAYAGVKKLVMMSPNDTLESQMERETRVIAEMARTKDAREGISAFVAKRKPTFTGE